MTRSGFAVLTCLGLLSCGLLGADDAEITLRTDASSYADTPESVITLTVSNESDDPIFYICSGQIYLEELENGSVINRWMIHGFEECLSAEPIDSDQLETFELGFDEKSALGNLTDARFDGNLKYQLVADLFFDTAFKRPLSDEQRTSNSFRVTPD